MLPGAAGEAQVVRIGQQEGEQQEEQQAEEEVFAWQSEDPWVESESMWRKVPQLVPICIHLNYPTFRGGSTRRERWTKWPDRCCS